MALKISVTSNGRAEKHEREAQSIRRIVGFINGEEFVQAAVCEMAAQMYGCEAQRFARAKETGVNENKGFRRKSRTDHMLV